APFTLTDTIDVTFAADFPLARNYTKVFCTSADGVENINLDDYRQFLTPQNPADLQFTYHNTLAEAQAGTNATPTTLVLNEERLIYVRIQHPQNTECFRVALLRFQFISAVIITESVSVCDTNNDDVENNFPLSTFNAVLFAPGISGAVTYYLSEVDAQNGTNPVATATLRDGMRLWLRFATANCSQVIGPVTVNFTPGPAVSTPIDLEITICDINDNDTEPYDFDLSVSGLI